MTENVEGEIYKKCYLFLARLKFGLVSSYDWARPERAVLAVVSKQSSCLSGPANTNLQVAIGKDLSKKFI